MRNLGEEYFQRAKEGLKPIGSPFYPENEVQDILESTDKEERREALAKFKDRLLAQKEAWARCQIVLEEIIELNPDIEKSQLMLTVGEFAKAGGFTGGQILKAEKIIDLYLAQHQRVIELQQEYPSKKSLLEILTEENFLDEEIENVTIEEGPISFYIWCDHDVFYKIYNQGKKINFKEEMHGCNYQIHGINVILINRESINSKKNQFDVPGHELQHAKNNLFANIQTREIIPNRYPKKTDLFKSSGNERSSDIESLIDSDGFNKLNHAELIRFLQSYGYSLAKDEIIATFTGARHWSSFSLDKNSFSLGRERDYSGLFKAFLENKGIKQWSKIQDYIITPEYLEVIGEALDAIDALMESEYYTKEETLALLTTEPLHNWPKTIRRILEAKGARLA